MAQRSKSAPRFKSPGFVDLFYAVVVGGSFNLISDVNDYSVVAMKVFLIVVVLEDWFAYYSFVLPNIVERQRYTLYSLTMEFCILMSWYLAAASLNSAAVEQKYHLFIWISIFFFVRFFTGLRAHWKRSTFSSKEFFSETLYLLQAAINLGLYILCLRGNLTLPQAFLLFFATFVLVTTVWWALRYKEFMARN